MTIAYWCVLVAGLQHIPFTAMAKLQDGFRGLDNSSPRDYLENTSGVYQRAHWVQQNSFEAFPFFAAAVVIAHLTESNQLYIDAFAVAFVVLRILYGIVYLANFAWLRTTVWYLALGCCIALFFIEKN